VSEFLQANWLTLVAVAGFVGFFLLFRNRASRISGLDEVLGGGQPVIVEVFSNT